MKVYLKKSIYLPAALAIVLVLAAGNSYLSADTEDVVKKSFNVESGGTLTLNTNMGTIQVETHSSKTINVEVIKKVGYDNADKAREIFSDFNLDFNQSGSDLRIEGKYKRQKGVFSWSGSNRFSVKYLIKVPQHYNLDLYTSGGSIAVSSIEGDVKVNTSGGSLKLAEIKGEVNGHTSGGSIKLESCAGNAKVTTSGGSITIGKVEGEVRASTSGGSITVDEVMGTINASTSGGSVRATISKQPKGDCKLTTSGGSVSVKLADDINVDLYAKSSGGRVHADIKNISGDISKQKIKGKINDGGPELYLSTSGGSVRIDKID